MKRTQIINIVAAHCKAQRYLEIGVAEGNTLGNIRVETRTGVDPAPRMPDPAAWAQEHKISLFVGSSDRFFEWNKATFDLAFVDGLHLYDQAIKDLLNAFNCLAPGGFVLAHDLLPESAAAEARDRNGAFIWNGDVWKIGLDVHRNYPDIRFFTVDCDCGVGVFWRTPDRPPLTPAFREEYVDLAYPFFARNKESFMNIVPPEEEAITALLRRADANRGARRAA